MDETDAKRRAPQAAQPETNVPPRDEDPHATPVGRGANPGDLPDTYPLSSRGGSIAGQRGHASSGARGGPSGIVSRENEDTMQEVRDAPQGGPDASANDSST